ncbi:hypothetical protein [Litoribacter populi]|uniref:hypothetical protein n=1 Tax=Litoribacter populi TaxID=2598460 RepID=UPI00117F3C23|nr:hypothetical protein [Litoribacter populi]
MNTKQIEQLCASGNFLGENLDKEFLETHISWVVFSNDFAFKIKKPVKYPFLDYSSLERRKANCHKELEVNGRYSNIYLEVVELRQRGDTFFLGGEGGDVVDYAVRVKKLSTSKKMDVLLDKKKVELYQMVSLAKVVGEFHMGAKVVKNPFQLEENRRLFNDINSVIKDVSKNFGNEVSDILSESMAFSDIFLKTHSRRFKERIKSSLQRDVHGDLHSGNIFLYKKPILFDGIEFNDSMRQVDLAYEVAFLCMDLESRGYLDLSQTFLVEYRKSVEIFEQPEDTQIFIYFKMLRANVRAKIHMYGARQAEDLAPHNLNLQRAKTYIIQMRKYLDQLEGFYV